jgi:cobalt ECF transporter T component CbiQ
VGVLAGLYALGLVLALASGLSLRFFVARVWLFVPIFTMVIVVPATLSFVTPGHIVVPLGNWWGSPVGLTRQGLTSAALIVSRVATSISFAVLLALTTPWSRLLSALQALHVPRVFVLVTGMAYRYIFYLLGSVTEMYTARKARTVSQDSSVKTSRAFVSASAGTLFARTYTLSEEVHMAMISRGYAAGRPTAERRPVRTTSWAFLGFTVLSAAIAIGVDRV